VYISGHFVAAFSQVYPFLFIHPVVLFLQPLQQLMPAMSAFGSRHLVVELQPNLRPPSVDLENAINKSNDPKVKMKKNEVKQI